MCSRLLKRRMESSTSYQGDLADIVRAGAATDGGVSVPAPDSWQFIPTSNNDPVNKYDFGDPFTFLGDPLLQDIMDPPLPAGFPYHNNNNNNNNIGGVAQKVVVVEDDGETMKRRPSSIFSRMLQISPQLPAVSPSSDRQTAAPPVGSPRVSKTPPPNILLPNNNSNNNNNNRNLLLIPPSGSKGCLVESTGLQISSPRNTGIKRRKSQARKVVCIPAPAPANSRSSGEVVPSDLWAWRKYGQKPIKGSPYPRGYYRCSSSKGCSARKQVERSRTDPNMLVITYTSEHNHPWPTQRNALAGSTRSQPSKTNPQKPSAASPPKHDNDDDDQVINVAGGSVKLEEIIIMDQEFDNNLLLEIGEFDQGFPAGTYKPSLDSSNQSEDSFFADLGEIEPDPLDLLFSTRGNSKDLDPFVFYDWATNDTIITNATSSFGEPKQAGGDR